MKNTNKFWFDNVDFRTHPWPGLMWITPMIQVPNVEEARNLYSNAFQFVPIFEDRNPGNPDELAMARLRYRGTNFVVMKEGMDYEGQSPAAGKSVSPFLFYVYFDDVSLAFDRAVKAGMKVVMEPKETPWGDIRARVQCRYGYGWDLAQRKISAEI